MSLNFKFSKNNEVLKEYNIIPKSLEDYSEYRKSLNSLQGTVNEYLTTLVKSETAQVDALQEDDYISTDSEDEKSPKRNLSSERESKKNKIKKH